ncbi:hypothetical protein WG66_004501 [Moniliophthora roreri]|uniref:Transcription activator GCR1-like domain-containing protein n=1 Tax=Moniliophthora roreri TaxID=221103 RepID=A0A0W0FD05_MONRR|nr:hypothetical protein WG66_004501 [Moniliophthora roreri]
MLAQAEEEARMQLQELVPDIAIWVKGFIESETAHNRSCQAEMQREIQDTCSALHTVTQTLTVNSALKQKWNVDIRNLSAAQPPPTTGTLSKLSKCRRTQLSTTVPEPHEDEQPATSSPPQMKPSETQMTSTSSHTSPSNSSNSLPMPQSAPTSSSDLSAQTQLQQTDILQKQAEVMSGLERRFGAGKVSQHTWDWVYGLGDWIPWYQFGERPDREGIWQEHILGIGGQLSMQELEEQWTGKWKTNWTMKNESSRRQQLISLIDKLKSKPNWNIPLAFRFLNDHFPIDPKSTVSDPITKEKYLTSTGNFCCWLQKKDSSSY